MCIVVLSHLSMLSIVFYTISPRDFADSLHLDVLHISLTVGQVYSHPPHFLHAWYGSIRVERCSTSNASITLRCDALLRELPGTEDDARCGTKKGVGIC